MNSGHTLKDEAARVRIRTELDASLLVEAAAGTGKTSSMVERMVELIRTGTCDSPRKMAAITFTRKAAAEIRARFQSELEKAFHEHEGPPKERLGLALEQIDQLYIGTIHSFCARLLRERPVEASIDPAFQEMDSDEDILIRDHAWSLVEGELAGSGDLRDLRSVGLGLSQLAPAYRIVAGNLDVDQWTAPKVPSPDRIKVLKSLDRRADIVRDRLLALADELPRSPDKDEFEQRCWSLLRVHRMLNRDDLLDVMETAAFFARKPNIVQGEWNGEKKNRQDLTARAEIDRWEEFSIEMKERFLTPWHEHRYSIAMKVILKGRELYNRERRLIGTLNYQDLLILAADMLRENRTAREHFQMQFTHLLVDEFQDTDPVQAAVMMLLTADDSGENRWWECRPRPGSLFVVGDPKQSIYRFRRADISTYNRVKKIIEKTQGEDNVIYLTSNFRSISPILDWVNTTFDGEDVFNREAGDKYSPEYVPLEPGRIDGVVSLAGIKRIAVGQVQGGDPPGVMDEALAVAGIIRDMLDDAATVPRSDRELESGTSPEAGNEDFLIITWKKRKLQEFALRLSQVGIPCETTGGNTFSTSAPVRLLLTCLTAVLDPDNPVALVAALKSGLFGFSDPVLYRYRKAGGRFSFNAGIPGGLLSEESDRWEDALGRLRRYAGLINRLPPLTAFRLISSDMGLFALSTVGPMANLEAGNMEKLMEVVRSAEAVSWSSMELADHLSETVNGRGEFEGIPALPHQGGAVRIMNLHKVKGLQAPVVFLADPSGSRNEVDFHISRSDGAVIGHLVIKAPPSNGGGFVLAQPSGWQEMEEEEKKFKKAENDRLNYVATTRAGSMMCISHRNVKQMKSSKTFPTARLIDCEELTDPGPRQAPAAETVYIEAKVVDRELADIAVRRDSLKAPTFERFNPSQLGPQYEKTHPVGEHGTEWGTVVHNLLEAAMADPGQELLPLAESLLREQELSASHALEAVSAVRSVMASGLWQRAREAEELLTEVPFKMAREGDDDITVITSGVIDLVFKEEKGWVIVDYKTGGKAPERYAPQLEAYREAWQAMGCGEVKEIGIYWVDHEEYVVLDAVSSV